MVCNGEPHRQLRTSKSTTDSGWWLHAAVVARQLIHGTASSVSLDTQAYGAWVLNGFQHPLQWLAYQANRLRMQLPWPRLCGIWCHQFSSNNKVKCVQPLLPAHPRFGYTCRESQTPGLYSYSPKVFSTSTSTSTTGGLNTNTNYSGATGHDL